MIIWQRQKLIPLMIFLLILLSWLMHLLQASAQPQNINAQLSLVQSHPCISLLRPAPDMPGVWRATASKSTPGAKFLPLAWTFRISYRPWTSGGSTWSLRNLSRDPKDPNPQSPQVNGTLWKSRRHTHRMTQIAHLDLTIKAARANQRLIQDVRTVRRCNYHLRRKRA